MPTTYSINGTEGKGGALRMTIPLEVRQKLDIHKDDQVDIQVVGDVMEVRKHSREPAAPAVNREAPAANTVVVPTDDYIDFGDFCRRECDIQCQYGSHYLTGLAGYPNLGEGLRYTGNGGDYHPIRIHKDDAPVFKERLMKLKEPEHGRFRDDKNPEELPKKEVTK
jgi:antitoxin component of MazEF toxin-antitoxin module